MYIFTIIEKKKKMRKILLFGILFFQFSVCLCQKTVKHGPIFFRFYKNYISTQDGPVCNFTPSCSEYAKDVIKKKGVFLGMFYAADRLCRCHPYNLSQYYYNKPLDRAIDNP